VKVQAMSVAECNQEILKLLYRNWPRRLLGSPLQGVARQRLTALRSLAIRPFCNDVWRRISFAAAVGILHLKSFSGKRKIPGQTSGLAFDHWL
jgi:hypothetical protein